MKKTYLLYVIVASIAFISCDKDEIVTPKTEELTNNNSIWGNSDRSLFKIQNENGKYSFINNDGDTEFSTEYDYAEDFYNDRAVIGVGVETTERNEFKKSSTNIIYFINENGTYIDDEYVSFYGTYGIDQYNNKLPNNTVYYDYDTDSVLTNYQYDDLIDVAYYIEYNKYGIFDNTTYYYTMDDEQLTSDSESIYYDGLTSITYILEAYYSKVVTSELTYGYINTKGTDTIPATYTSASMYSTDGLAAVSESTIEDSQITYYYIDTEGSKISNDTYYTAEIFTEGLAAVKIASGDNYIFVDKDGLPVITKGYDDVYPFINGLAAVNENGFWGFIDTEGNEVVTALYKQTTGIYTHDLIGVSEEDALSDATWYFINENGEQIFGINAIYDELTPFYEGLAGVSTGGRWRFINTDGEYEFTDSYNNTTGFSEGYAAVQSSDLLWGYISTNGEYALAAQYLEAGDFINGVAQVEFTDNTWGYINTSGVTLWRSASTVISSMSATITDADQKNENILKALRLK